MNQNKKIKNICTEIFLTPILLCLITLTIMSAMMLLKLAEQNREMELHRLNDVLPSVVRSITANLLIGDPRSRKALIQSLKTKLKLSFIDISESDNKCINKHQNYWHFSTNFFRESCLSAPIIINSKKFVIIKSTLHEYEFSSLIKWLAWINLPLLFLGSITGFFQRKKIMNSIAEPILELSLNPEKLAKNKITALEIINLSNKFNSFITSLKENHDTIEKIKIKNTLNEVATQVAHDIRSPLAAIRIAVEGLINHSDSDVTIIKKSAERIEEIANNLLNQFNASKLQKSCKKNYKLEPVWRSI